MSNCPQCGWPRVGGACSHCGWPKYRDGSSDPPFAGEPENLEEREERATRLYGDPCDQT